MTAALFLLFWAWSLPCDAACQVRMAEPMPIWQFFVLAPLAVALQPQIAACLTIRLMSIWWALQPKEKP